MAASRKLKPSDAKNSLKIDQFFKPGPKRKIQNDENAYVNDENKVEKRKFGEKPVGLKDPTPTERLPLKDKTARVPLSDKTPLLRDPNPQQILGTTAKLPVPARKFAILTDEEIEKGIERAPTPPNQSPYSSQVFDSQEEKTPRLSQLPTQLDYSQWTASSPIPYEDSQASSQAPSPSEPPLTVFQDENDDPQSPFLIFKDEDSQSPFTVFKDENDDDSQSQPKNEQESPFTVFKDEEDEDDDDDLFTTTVNTTVKFPNQLQGSLGSLLYDDHEDSKSTSSFFSNHGGEDEEDNVAAFNNEDDGFTVSFVDSNVEFDIPEISSIPDGKTLSQEPQTLSQIMLPDPNPRGNDILEKIQSSEDHDF